jgi:TPR repeat protein
MLATLAILGAFGQVAMAADVESLQARCETDNWQACHDLGATLLGGEHPQPTTAAEAHERACSGGVEHSCLVLGLVLANPEPPTDTARATALLEPRCVAGESVACRGLALLLNDSRPPEDDAHRAMVLAEHACDAGDLPSCVLVGDWLADFPADMGSADRGSERLRHYALACSGGLLHGCSKVAAFTLVRTDGSLSAEAVETLEKNCRAGDAWACTVLQDWAPPRQGAR